MALDHQLKVSNWAQSAEARINSLFVSPILFPGSLRTMGGDSLNIAKLRELLIALSPPPTLPEQPVPPRGLTVIAESRLSTLRTLKHPKYDFRKLIRLCEELNTVYGNGCFVAAIMLTRAIIDHVPPLFGAKTFTEVANNYAGPKSFKETMQQLDAAARKIADLHLHTQIRSPETLPSPQQVSFGPALDVLLAEIIRLHS
jgi:hypothetical protein